MEHKSDIAAFRIFNTLLKGRETDRTSAYKALEHNDGAIDRPRLRALLLDALTREFKPAADDLETDPLVRTRGWLLGALARVVDDDAEAARVLRHHLDPKYEPNRWARFWTLAGLVAAGASDLQELARAIVKNDDNPWPHMLAVAILASRGDGESLAAMRKQLGGTSLQVATLRALRVVPIQAMVKNLCDIVDSGGLEHGAYDDPTYDALIALGEIPRTWPQAEGVAQTLTNAVRQCRKFTWLVDIRTKALRAIGNLGVESTESLLLEELIVDNASIVSEAALALEKVRETRIAVAHVVEAASRADREHIEGYASALRWMNRDSVVEALEAAMVSGSVEQQEVAQILLREMGGAAAFEKLRARTKAISGYTEFLEKNDEKIRGLFETSITEARSGFKVATIMDAIVFFFGIGLVGISAGLVLYQGGALDKWAGVGLTGGAGVLGVIYGTLIAKPRRQVQAAVDHLMYLKIIFLAYLRQLHQVDLLYTRRMLEEKPLTVQDLDTFSENVSTAMRTAVERLTLREPKQSES